MTDRPVAELLEMILEQDTTLNAFVHVDRSAMAEVSSGPLSGRCVAVKDNVAVRGAPWACGSASRGTLGPARGDAEVVRRLRAAGATVVGTTNLDELAMGASTETSVFGPTRNPHDPTRTAGGSSGGSGAAVAAHGIAAIGTDTGGSIREPAAFCGVVGMAPSPGSVPVDGVVDFAPSLDRVGPMAPDVLTAALLHDVMAGSNGHHAAARRGARSRSLAGWRIGRVVPMSGDRNAPGALLRFEEAVEAMRLLGAEIVDVEVPRFGELLDTYLAITSVEALPVLEQHAPGGLGDEASSRLEIARRLDGSHEHAEALAVRERITADARTEFASCDVMISPTVPLVAPPLGRPGIDDPLARPRTDWWTVEANMARLPALSLPCGLSDGLPVGLQLMAATGQDATLYRVAATVEQAIRT
ncbi:amidase [Aeromicrobium sp. CTD01-1L150]|uniref:amidase n=1 Tax=Aeromicrobium sp. CTD01-1L150 TaxID=3341830 RepID=UPI0035C0BBCB